VTQQGIETILMRRLAERLTMPIVLVDPRGDLVYFNPAAALVLGRRFEDTGPIVRGEWRAVFRPTHPDGSPYKREDLPLYIATDDRKPSYRGGWLRGLDGVERRFESIAFPLMGQGERMLGAVGVFWDRDAPPRPGVPHAGGRLDLASPGGDRPVELLLMRQLASYLTPVIYLVGADGSVLFFNEPAERLFGRRFDESDPISVEEMSAQLQPTDEAGRPVDLEDRAMIVALRRQRPARGRASVHGFDQRVHDIEGLAFPLVETAGRQLGAVGIFWERTAS
jgi:PAS domain-containing protein